MRILVVNFSIYGTNRGEFLSGNVKVRIRAEGEKYNSESNLIKASFKSSTTRDAMSCLTNGAKFKFLKISNLVQISRNLGLENQGVNSIYYHEYTQG